MSRSLGLREDQREGEVLATLIFRLFPLDPVWCHREQARSHKGSPVNTGLVQIEDQMWERACSRRGPDNQ
jgi:hypothetical protein